MLDKKATEKLKKGKFRKDVVDIIMILPAKEGIWTQAPHTVLRIPINSVANVDFMTKCFRQMWISLCNSDPQLKKYFDDYFHNQALAQKRADKLLQKAMIKANNPLSRAIEEKLKENSKYEGIDGETKDGGKD